MKSRVLVTGGAGFIGSHLVERLLAGGHAVRVLDNFSTGSRANLPFAGRYGAALEVIEGDIRNGQTVASALAGVSLVFHQAAMRSVPRSVEDPLGANEHNVTGTLNVLEAARRTGVRRVVYASSSSVYGDRPDLPKREDQPPAPISPYAVSKTAGEQYAAVWHRLFGLETVGLRYFNVYGPNEAHKGRMASVAFHAYRQLLSAGKVRLFVGSGGYADGEQRRDFVHVDDVVDVNLWFLEHRDISGVYNCGTGRAQSFNELAAAVINAVQGTQWPVRELLAKGLIEYIPFPPQLVGKYQSFTQADLTRLRTAGFAAEFMTVERGAAAYVNELQKPQLEKQELQRK